VPHKVEVCIDVADPDAVRPFWQAALDYSATEVDSGATILTDPSGHGPTVWFQPVPESKTIKNRVHLDIWLDSREQTIRLADRLEGLGGTKLTEFDDFIVFADPEGNEVCLNWPS
jgi:4a-hydroxytetrahydrobiopterin dehydratase